MADEPTNGGKRRRGRRRGGRPGGQPSEIPPSQEQEQPDITSPGEDVVQPEIAASSLGDEAEVKSSKRRERKPATQSADVNPMDFWRSGRSRSHRTVAAGAAGTQNHGIIYSIRHMYFPPWVPVAVICVLVFGILGLLFITRSATGAPRINDHWHASYTFYACGVKQPNAPTWESGVHTHGDGIFHIHPFSSAEEGAGARMTKWFEYGDGKLDQDEIRMPGSSHTYKNGEVCADDTPDAGQEGVLQVFVNSTKMENWSRYIPKDGDIVRLVFGPADSTIQLTDRQVINESEATRTIEVTVDGNEGSTAFSPAVIDVDAGETVKLHLTNVSDISHGLRIAGEDGTYENGDDFAVIPDGTEDPSVPDTSEVIQPGESGFVIIRFDNPGQVTFKDPTATNPNTNEPFAVGTILVGNAEEATPSPEEEAQQTADVVVDEDGFTPADVTLEEGKSFSINLTVEDAFAHAIRIDGEDGAFNTEDDILSADIEPGATGLTPPKLLPAGDYAFRDDLHPELTGTITIE